MDIRIGRSFRCHSEGNRGNRCHGQSRSEDITGKAAVRRPFSCRLLHFNVNRHQRRNNRGPCACGCRYCRGTWHRRMLRNRCQPCLHHSHHCRRSFLRGQSFIHLRHYDRRYKDPGSDNGRQVQDKYQNSRPGSCNSHCHLYLHGYGSRYKSCRRSY